MKKYRWNIWLVILSAAALLGYGMYAEGFGKALGQFAAMHKGWLAAGFLCLAAYLLLESGILHILIKKLQPKHKFVSSLKVSLIGQLFNCITPFASGGQPAQIYALRKSNVSVGTASSVLLFKFIVYQLTLTVYTFIIMLTKLAYFVNGVKSFAYLAIIGFITNLLVAFGLLAVAFFKGFLKKFFFFFIDKLARIKLIKNPGEKYKRFEVAIDRFHADFKHLKNQIPLLVLCTVLTVVQLSCFLLIPYTITRALGISGTPVLTVMSAAAFVMLISAFVPIPGTIGAAEGSFYLFFTLFIPTSMIFVATLTWRLFTFYLPIIIGGITLFTLKKRDKIDLSEMTSKSSQ